MLPAQSFLMVYHGNHINIKLKTNNMKKVQIFLLAIIAAFASCKDGKLPNASITGATFGDYLPYVALVLGILSLVYVGITYATDKKITSAKLFWFGAGGIIAVVMGLVGIYS